MVIHLYFLTPAVNAQFLHPIIELAILSGTPANRGYTKIEIESVTTKMKKENA